MPIRVMHFADTHFGVELYGKPDPDTGLNSRLIDFRDTLCRGVDSALEKGIDIALFAGDAYKGRDPSQTHQREFALCLRRLTDAGIPVVMLTGNHDVPNVRGRAHAMEIYRTLGVENIHILSKPEVKIVDTARGKLQIAAMPYLMKGFTLSREETQGKSVEEVRALMEQGYQDLIASIADEVDKKLPTVLMGHFWVREARLSSWQDGYFNVNSEAQVNVSDLSRPGTFDYVALGHIHKHQDLNRGKQPPIVYPGSPDYIDFGERNEDKGYVLVEVEKGSAKFEFVEIPGRRKLIQIDVDCSALPNAGQAPPGLGVGGPTEGLLAADTPQELGPTEEILAEIAKHVLKGNIVRLTYRITPDQIPFVREKEIKEALAPAFLIVSVRPDIQRDRITRDKLLTESLDPLAALERYLTEQGKESRKDVLMPYAQKLVDDLDRHESLALL